MRAVMEDVELTTGRRLKAADRVALHVGVANHDPEIFGDIATGSTRYASWKPRV